ncbi:hypothetical protein [Orgyia leucostigma nucleopolyhedrovirus]|uniref:Uncharacterized protein n=1 Tax=Orgyia leucostigma nucleopolyhedrovirus TaxID=490711 RepID=B0FDN7_9ABAC|nr:hypothetical protein [Orgyia leucostigma nucleopolyhedrovirus]ABY65745.1 hypothetical protein [Orgyia leucostigma nucleopolyhedrovirus]
MYMQNNNGNKADGRKYYYENSSHNKSKHDSVRQQYDAVLQAKKLLEVKSTHQEKLKKITKDTKDLANIDARLKELRSNFLDFSVQNL